jgi:hypothetical protein
MLHRFLGHGLSNAKKLAPHTSPSILHNERSQDGHISIPEQAATEGPVRKYAHRTRFVQDKYIECVCVCETLCVCVCV